MNYPDRWTTKIPAGRPWSSPDGTTSAWRVAGDDYRIQTSDRQRAVRLDKLTRVNLVGHSLVSYQLWIFRLAGGKMNTKAVRRILLGSDTQKPGAIDRVSGPNLRSKAPGRPAPGVAPA